MEESPVLVAVRLIFSLGSQEAKEKVVAEFRELVPGLMKRFPDFRLIAEKVEEEFRKNGF